MQFIALLLGVEGLNYHSVRECAHGRHCGNGTVCNFMAEVRRALEDPNHNDCPLILHLEMHCVDYSNPNTAPAHRSQATEYRAKRQ